jgi:hypothetical protein
MSAKMKECEALGSNKSKNLYWTYLNITSHHFSNSMNFIHIYIAQSSIDIV